jgi:hypothetical protein
VEGKPRFHINPVRNLAVAPLPVPPRHPGAWKCTGQKISRNDFNSPHASAMQRWIDGGKQPWLDSPPATARDSIILHPQFARPSANISLNP